MQCIHLCFLFSAHAEVTAIVSNVCISLLNDYSVVVTLAEIFVALRHFRKFALKIHVMCAVSRVWL